MFFHDFGFGIFGAGVAGLGILSAFLSVAYPIFVIVMIIDGFLRMDAEYPGTEPNRKVLWVIGMVLIHPVAIPYYFMVYSKIRRTRRSEMPTYTAVGQPTPAPSYAAPGQTPPPAA